MNDKEKNIYLEQRGNCFLSLIISIIFIIGLIIKTIYNTTNILLDTEMIICLIIPILFLNTTFFTLLTVLKNTLIYKSVFNNKNKNLLNILTFIIMIFFLSIVLIINKSTTGFNNIYCIFLISCNFLYSSLIIKKIFNYEIENKN